MCKYLKVRTPRSKFIVQIAETLKILYFIGEVCSFYPFFCEINSGNEVMNKERKKKGKI